MIRFQHYDDHLNFYGVSDSEINNLGLITGDAYILSHLKFLSKISIVFLSSNAEFL